MSEVGAGKEAGKPAGKHKQADKHAGKQAAVLNMLIENLNDPNISLEKKLKELLGHTPKQVMAGAALGVAVAFVSGVLHGYVVL